MKKNSLSLRRYTYLDSLKGIACIMIMLCHYLGLVKYSQDFRYSNLKFIQTISSSIFGLIISESIWLQLFFIISGFLISQSKIKTLKQFLLKSLRRFLRFYVPILGACIYIHIIYCSVGFYNNKTQSLFLNEWFQSYYSSSLSVSDLILDPIKTVLFSNDSLYNAPFWVITKMFHSSIIIYLFSWLTNHISSTLTKFLLGLFVTLLSSFLLGDIGFSCCMGMLVYLIIELDIPFLKNAYVSFLIIIISLLSIFGVHVLITDFVIKTYTNHLIWLNYNTKWSAIYFAFFILGLQYNNYFKHLFSHNLFLKFNIISFGIYSFHWPVICSVGAFILTLINGELGFIFCWLISIIFTFLISIIYNHTIERLSSFVLSNTTL